MWNLKYDANELIYEIETDSQTQKTDWWLPKGKGEKGKGKGWGRDKLGVWDYQIQITTYKIDKQEVPTVQHRELYTIS